MPVSQLSHYLLSFLYVYLVFIKWSYKLRSLQSCWLLNLEWLAYFERLVQSPLNICVMPISCPFFDLRLTIYNSKYRCPDYCYVGLTHVYLKFKPAGAWCCCFMSHFLQLCIQTLSNDTLQLLDALENIEVSGSQHVTKLQVKLTKPSNSNTLYIEDTPGFDKRVWYLQ